MAVKKDKGEKKAKRFGDEPTTPKVELPPYELMSYKELVDLKRRCEEYDRVFEQGAINQLAKFTEYRTANPRGGLSHNKHKEYWPIIRIAKQEGVGGNRDVPVAVNGFAITLNREKDIPIRPCFLEALQNAAGKVYQQHTDPVTGEIIQTSYDTQSYPFSVVKAPNYPPELLALAGLVGQPGMRRE